VNLQAEVLQRKRLLQVAQVNSIACPLVLVVQAHLVKEMVLLAQTLFLQL
jgi:hypothetical protein